MKPDTKNIKKIELVSPAGGWEQLIAAINAGADAVYLGYKKFGARAFAENFEFLQLKKAVKISHDNGVKVYLALNTLFKDAELTELAYFLNEFLAVCSDGIIIQDMGLFKIITELFPGIRIHASTQMNLHNTKSIELLSELGFSRAVLAREMTIDGIINITKARKDFEVEVFAHGSQCYSYSGNCYFSSFTGARSGNRGRCSQPCRMKYRLGLVQLKGSEDKKRLHPKEIQGTEAFLLSKNDLFTLEIIPHIAAAGVSALKIEGRMKTAEYVGIVTAIYRKYLDIYFTNPEQYNIEPEDLYKITQIFSRGLGTGYFLEDFPENIVSIKKSGSIGNFLGRINKITFSNTGEKEIKEIKKPASRNLNERKSYGVAAGAKRVSSIIISSNWRLNKEDIIEIWTNRGNEQVRITDFSQIGEKGGRILYRIIINKDIRINEGDRVFMFFDSSLDREAKNLFASGKIKRSELYGDKGPAKKNKPKGLWDRAGHEVKIARYFKYYERLTEKTGLEKENSIIKKSKKITVKETKNPVTITAEVYSIEDAVATAGSGIENIVLNNFLEVFRMDYLDRISNLNRECAKNNTRLVIKTPNILYDGDFIIMEKGLDALVSAGVFNFAVSNIGVLKQIAAECNKKKNIEIYLDHSLNIFNHKALSFFDSVLKTYSEKQLLKCITFSVELSLTEMGSSIDLIRNCGTQNIEFSVYSYGFYPVMESRFKIDYLKKQAGSKNGSNQAYYIIDRKGYEFRVISGYNENLVFLSSKNICNFFDLPEVLKSGISNIYIDTRTFAQSDINQIIESYKKAIQMILNGQLGEYSILRETALGKSLFSGYTRGHLFRELL